MFKDADSIDAFIRKGKKVTTTLNRTAYEELIAEDLEWLMKQPRSLEREHIAMILKQDAELRYGLAEKLASDLQSAVRRRVFGDRL